MFCVVIALSSDWGMLSCRIKDTEMWILTTKSNISKVIAYFKIAGAHGILLSSSKLFLFTLFKSVSSPLSAKQAHNVESSVF
jgi:hypothetical protein